MMPMPLVPPPPPKKVPVSRFLEEVRKLEDTPYLWGGCGSEGPGQDGKMWSQHGLIRAPYVGVDCVHLVTVAYHRAGGPDWRLTHNTDVLWLELEVVAVPRPGDLAFYAAASPRSQHDVEHVEVLVDQARHPLRGYRTIGAIGGDRTTRTQQIAMAQNAKVTYRESNLARPRFCGYRRLPLAYDLVPAAA